ncbi:nitrogenase iron-molybdenum cofactor biosynthesis protein NifE [Candidatus Magnetaquicoccus inordinatus]|uniref:nitrogenase iron-molybdenum cofactor biosynthesis protein NifE n=1 Tax=Candidatus Magnetaquicoccus inordinatus TaxID=2496818 RepID=UPI00102BD11F|nr:nitrogenase iron-molybdenum cofactor biosynthesis protein NifE [Candidatus Magnetaquicoccus inordinatus]
MRKAEIAQLMVEPACPEHHADKVGCARLKPGAAAGGCSFDGAQITLFPITDAAHLVHGPIGCAGSSWNGRGSLSSGPDLHRLGLTSDLSEQDIIMGRSEQKLLFALKEVVQQWHPAAIFVYQTCVTAMMGDDLQALCQTASKQFSLPVIPVDAAGFYGSKNLGNRIAGEVALHKVIGSREPDPPPHREGMRVHDVNLVGEFNIAGEFWHVAPLFDELGLRILGTLSGDVRFRQVQSMHRGKATMLVCSKALINVARGLSERYGIPWFEGSFYGIRDTSAAFREFARLLADPELSERTEQLIAREEAAIQQALQPWRQRLTGKRAVLYTGGVKSWSVISALQELGIEVMASGVKKSTEKDKTRIRDLLGEDAQLIEEGNPRLLLESCRAHKADLLIAGGRNLYTALKARIPFLDINQEREHPYAGYRGMLNLAQQLVQTLESPIWERVVKPPPWIDNHPNSGWR